MTVLTATARHNHHTPPTMPTMSDTPAHNGMTGPQWAAAASDAAQEVTVAWMHARLDLDTPPAVVDALDRHQSTAVNAARAARVSLMTRPGDVSTVARFAMAALAAAEAVLTTETATTKETL